jgi:hypothetical protein
MVVRGMIALALVSSSVAASSQQQPAPVAAKPVNGQKVTCRIHMDANIPRRMCMTNADWAKVDAQTQDGPNLSRSDTDASYINRHGCGPDKGSVLGAC